MAEYSPVNQETASQQVHEQAEAPLGTASFEVDKNHDNDDDEDEEHAALLLHAGGGDEEDGTIGTSTTLQSEYYQRIIQTRQSRSMMFALAIFLVVAALMGLLSTSRTSHGEKGHPSSDTASLSTGQENEDPLRKQPTVPPQQKETTSSTTQPPPKDTDNNDDETNKIKYYSEAKTDRAGAQILDMLEMDAFIFQEGGVFGGACAKFATAKEQKKFDEHLDAKKRLIKLLGLETIFKFACPTDEELASGKAKMLTQHDYHKFSSTFSMEWVEHVRAKSTFPYAPPRAEGAPLQVAVHMRRGDYSPCRNGHGQKYLPNQYYIDVLDEYLPQYCPTMEACNLTIYTERRSYEDFKPFEERNYHLDFDSSLEQIWTAFINADLLFLSRSSFSWVPGIMNVHKVVTPDYKYPVCDNWDVASEEICSKSNAITEGYLNNDCRRRMWEGFLW